MKKPSYIPFLITALFSSCAALAGEYYVSTTGSDDNDGSSEAPFATIDCAITNATASTDVIYVAAGTYSTTTQWGPNLKAALVGQGSTRDDVIIQSSGSYRTLRMASGSMVTNVTIIGEGSNKADKGGAVEMSGGTLVDCVVKNGTATSSSNTNGGNIYMAGSSVVDNCEIFGGTANKRGGNVYVDSGTLKNSTIYDGTSSNVGGNIYQYAGTISNCVIRGGTSVNDGGNVRMNGSCVLVDSVISDGHITTGSEKKGANVYMDSSSAMSRCRLAGGESDNYNSASLCVYSSSASVEDCLVTGCSCGGVLLGATSYIYNSTIIDNDQYGIWSWTANQHLFNTVIFGNTLDDAAKDWTGNQPTHSSAEFLNCAATSGSMSSETFPTLVQIDSSVFTDYANGDYTPVAGSALIDAGVSDPRGASASTTDLAGNIRTSGTVDIGCYEYQKPEMTVRISGATYSQVYAPSTVTFTHVVENSADEENVSFTYNFGDGSDSVTTTESTISHAYSDPGVYTVTIAATNDCEEEYAEMTYDGYVSVASSIVYVTPGNTSGQAFPYNTPETGYASLKTAVQAALDGYELLLGEGVHETSDQISFSKAIALRGLGATPEDVIVRNTSTTPNTYYHRTLEVNNATGRVENITIENGCVKNQFGGNLRLVAGVVSNCVIRGGLTVADSGNAGGGGVEIAGEATLTHCVVSNNTVQGTSNNGSYAGGAVIIAYGAKKGHVSNCLVAYNTYESSDSSKSGAAGVRFIGSNDNTSIENCTIVSNVVVGSVSDDSAGLYCTTWYGRLRNNIVMGNYETEKGAFTSSKVDTVNCTYVNCLTDSDAELSKVFTDFAGGDFTIRPRCAAYNKGTDGLALSPSVDLAGNPRVFGKSIDIGCYECQRKPGFALVVR